MTTARRICCPTIACVLLALTMTGAAAASASQQDLRSPDARDVAAGRGTFTSRDVRSPQTFTDRQRAVVTRFKRSPAYQQALREAATVVKPPPPAPVRSNDAAHAGKRTPPNRSASRLPRTNTKHDVNEIFAAAPPSEAPAFASSADANGRKRAAEWWSPRRVPRPRSWWQCPEPTKRPTSFAVGRNVRERSAMSVY